MEIIPAKIRNKLEAQLQKDVSGMKSSERIAHLGKFANFLLVLDGSFNGPYAYSSTQQRILTGMEKLYQKLLENHHYSFWDTKR